MYQKAELIVIPSLEDGQPFVTGEAMASGIPVIVSSSCGSADWVTPDWTGWVVDPGNAESIATALETALRRRKDLASMGVEARRVTEERAGPQAMKALSEWALSNL
jgi:UDP-glucose:(heptosyl)LPS alpha-1,3-glucosyltransferase